MYVRYLVRALAGLALAALLAYVLDGLIARAKGQGAFGQVTVQSYYAVPLKGAKTEFIPLDPDTRTCVNALFPHFGDPPCWYLKRHQQQRIDM